MAGLLTPPVPHLSPGGMTIEDYLELPEDGPRAELVDGELRLVPSPDTSHQRSLRGLFRKLDSHVTAHSLGEVLFAPMDLRVGPNTMLEPDILFIEASHPQFNKHVRYFDAPIALVIEALSPGTARWDRAGKSRRYAAAGIQNYWIIDPANRTMEAWTLRNGVYVTVDQDAGETFAAPPFETLAIRYADIFPL